jgi:hypothetical protein
VYLDEVEEAQEAAEAERSETEPEEATWPTAVDAAPWLGGGSDPDSRASPEELYETLKPFKDKVATDIKDTEQLSSSDEEPRPNTPRTSAKEDSTGTP